jgi:hypothetical protein
VTSTTVTPKLPFATLPTQSLAAQNTLVVPIGNCATECGAQVTI